MDTKEILKTVRRIEIITSRMVNEVMAGEYHSVFKGRGMEFDEVREYTPGDDVRTIDWNVTARAGFPHVKRYVEERELTVMLLVDASMSGEFGTTDFLKSEKALRLSALLAFSAIKNNDRVGLILFTDEVERYIPPKKGKNHVLRLIRELLTFKAKGKKTDIPKALEYLNKVTTRKAVTFLISDFFDDNIARALGIANRRHDLVAVKIGDPRESGDLPALGFIEFEDAETGEILVIDTYNRAALKPVIESSRKAREELERLFLSINVDFALIDTDDFVMPIVNLFHKRAKRY
ncbi:MAG: DUF58 domain-containing protein [Candidatus Sumerlaeota bacterium]|nr:DUF58 domain-containing protein [Candidatus Sumerlaeota bacterium]